jgi:hypothetical protein
MSDAERKAIDVSGYTSYEFVLEGKKKFATITCSTCAAVVKDAFAHALFHKLNNQHPHSGHRYQGKYSDGRLVIKLDHWGRRLE